jgi:erythromycin esterase-like protein
LHGLTFLLFLKRKRNKKNSPLLFLKEKKQKNFRVLKLKVSFSRFLFLGEKKHKNFRVLKLKVSFSRFLFKEKQFSSFLKGKEA